MRDLSTQFIGCGTQTRRFAKPRGAEKKEKKEKEFVEENVFGYDGLDLSMAGFLRIWGAHATIFI